MDRQPRIRFGTCLRLGPLVLVATLALAGCGRKGPLSLPAGAPETQSPAAADAQQARVLPRVDDPGLIQPPTAPPVQVPPAVQIKQQAQNPPPPINGPNVKTGKPFILDPLL